MNKITKVEVKNYKKLSSFTRMFDDISILDLGKNRGNTTVLDAILFVHDCLVDSVQDACDKRGGFCGIITDGFYGKSIEVEITLHIEDLSYIYTLDVGGDSLNRVWINKEHIYVSSFDRESDDNKKLDLLYNKEGDYLESENCKYSIKKERPVLMTLSFMKDYSILIDLCNFLSHMKFFDIDSRIQESNVSFGSVLMPSGYGINRYIYNRSNDIPEALKRLRKIFPEITNIKADMDLNSSINVVFTENNKDFYSNFVSRDILKTFLYNMLILDNNVSLLLVKEKDNDIVKNISVNKETQIIIA